MRRNGKSGGEIDMRTNLRHIVAVGIAFLCCLCARAAIQYRVGGRESLDPDRTRWRQRRGIGDRSKSASDGVRRHAGLGVLKTVDGGITWVPANTGLSTINVYALAIDPVTSSTLIAGTDAGIFKSTDGGQNWIAANAGPLGVPGTAVTFVVFDSASPATIYAVTYGGIFKSVDGTASWSSITGPRSSDPLLHRD